MSKTKKAVFLLAALLGVWFALPVAAITSTQHDCNIFCYTIHWTPVQCHNEVHDYHTDDLSPGYGQNTFCTNYTDGSGIPYGQDGDDYFGGTGTCTTTWPSGATARLNCQSVGDYVTCSISGLITCKQPNGTWANRGYSIGCSATGRAPLAIGDRDQASCSALGENGQGVSCGPDGNAWVHTSAP